MRTRSCLFVQTDGRPNGRGLGRVTPSFSNVRNANMSSVNVRNEYNNVGNVVKGLLKKIIEKKKRYILEVLMSESELASC